MSSLSEATASAIWLRGWSSAPSLANSAASKVEGSASGCWVAKVRPAWTALWLLSPPRPLENEICQHYHN